MTSEHIRALQDMRERTLEQRHKLVMALAAPQEQGGAQDLREMFLKIQMTVEAVDRALKNE